MNPPVLSPVVSASQPADAKGKSKASHPPSDSTPSNPNSKKQDCWYPSINWSNWAVNFRIQPEYEVRLEDVLARRHLPPLGLKDFEEWLVFVEGSVENL